MYCHLYFVHHCFQETGIPSRLAKASFFRRFLQILNDPKISLREITQTNSTKGLMKNDNEDTIVEEVKADKRRELCSQLNQYCTAKLAATEFQV